MFPARLADEISAAFADLVAAGAVTPSTVVLPSVRVERPVRPTRGDFASPVALRLAGSVDQPAWRLAELLATRLGTADGIAASHVAGPGFVNIELAPRGLAEIVRGIVSAGATYGVPGDIAGGPVVPQLPPTLASDLRYAHARLAGYLRAGTALGVRPDPDRLDLELLGTPPQRPLVCALAEFPGVVERTTKGGSVRWRDRYLVEVLADIEGLEAAGGILPRGDEEPSPSHATQLGLVNASRIVLANAISLCGLVAPDRM
ncbi:DALR anticodon-binding domain-containing protein [Actinopolymorpha alba]|uniref:DALR anticodon-binding domain-containing protein n=1 Tax=Actinopolymorpha alba TaxID=533267 RepID=UPI000366F9C6|nr:DALR anticodon-binding domain-containing protein [Actinopolymorpha alba]